MRLYYLFICFYFFSCVREFERPEWKANILTPLFSTNLTIQQIIKDSTLSIKNDSVRIVFSQNLLPYNMDSLLQLDVKPFIRNIKLDSIKLNDQRLSYHSTIAELTDSTIPDGYVFPFSIPFPMPPITDTIDGSHYFRDLLLKNGKMKMSFNNSLPVTLNNVTFSLKNMSSGTVIYSGSYSSLPAHTITYDSISLAGKQIEGNMIINFSAIINITAGTVVDYNDFIEVEVLLSNMQIQSAQAVFPGQTIIDHQEVVYLENMEDREVTYALIQRGTLRVRVISTIEEETYFDYYIPNAKKNNIPFHEFMTLPPAPLNGSIIREFLYDFNDYDFDFTGLGDTVNAFYNRITGRIDSSGNMVNLTLEDSVDIIVEVLGLEPGYARGYLGKQTMNIAAGSLHFDAFSEFAIDSLSLEGAKITMSIENHLGLRCLTDKKYCCT